MISRHKDIQNKSYKGPIYIQIQEDIIAQIEEKSLKVGDKISTERVLACQYNSSVGTIRQALSNLVSSGYLYRHQGKGTFIAPGAAKLKEGLLYYRFVENFHSDHHSIVVKVLPISKTKQDAENADYFGSDLNANFFKFERILQINERAVAYLTSWLSCELFPDFDNLSTSILEEVTLYSLVEKKYGLPVRSYKDLFSAVAADDDQAKLFDVKKGSPLLKIDMEVRTLRNIVYEYRTSYCLTSESSIVREFTLT